MADFLCVCCKKIRKCTCEWKKSCKETGCTQTLQKQKMDTPNLIYRNQEMCRNPDILERKGGFFLIENTKFRGTIKYMTKHNGKL